MGHVSLEEVITSHGIEYRIVREDGIILATTFIKHYADVILHAIAVDIDSYDDELHG